MDYENDLDKTMQDLVLQTKNKLHLGEKLVQSIQQQYLQTHEGHSKENLLAMLEQGYDMICDATDYLSK